MDHVFDSIKYVTKINFNPHFAFFNMSTKKLSITYVACSIFLLDNSVLDHKENLLRNFLKQ